MLREVVQPAGATRLGGFPEWYWTIYPDDYEGPFDYPIPSPAVVKRVGAPHPALALVMRRSKWVVALASAVFLVVTLLPAGVAVFLLSLIFIIHCIWSWFLIRDVRLCATLSL